MRLQNSRIFCEHERRGQYSNERSGAGVETARKAGERACDVRALQNREEKTTVLQSSER